MSIDSADQNKLKAYIHPFSQSPPGNGGRHKGSFGRDRDKSPFKKSVHFATLFTVRDR